MLDAWARQWGVPAAAVADLRRRLGVAEEASRPDSNASEGHSESNRQSLILDTARKCGIHLTRNNVGALQDERGVPVRYGLFNETKERNAVVKSGDLIGIRPVLIGPKHLGTVIGQFVSVECKKEGWVYKGDKHETAQRNFVEFVISKGGLAMFANGPDNFQSQLR